MCNVIFVAGCVCVCVHVCALRFSGFPICIVDQAMGDGKGCNVCPLVLQWRPPLPARNHVFAKMHFHTPRKPGSIPCMGCMRVQDLHIHRILLPPTQPSIYSLYTRSNALASNQSLGHTAGLGCMLHISNGTLLMRQL